MMVSNQQLSSSKHIKQGRCRCYVWSIPQRDRAKLLDGWCSYYIRGVRVHVGARIGSIWLPRGRYKRPSLEVPKSCKWHWAITRQMSGESLCTWVTSAPCWSRPRVYSRHVAPSSSAVCWQSFDGDTSSRLGVIIVTEGRHKRRKLSSAKRRLEPTGNRRKLKGDQPRQHLGWSWGVEDVALTFSGIHEC